jgi:hypothetical protein
MASVSTLNAPPDYRVRMPALDSSSSNHEPLQTCIISAQVLLSLIFRAASENIYSSELNFERKALSARQLDEELATWKLSLPQWLNPDVLSFREPEWINKQKLTLQLRKTRLSAAKAFR